MTWKQYRAAILERDGHRCRDCGEESLALKIHHIVHRSKGGLDDHDNLIALCSACHGLRHPGQMKRLVLYQALQEIQKDRWRLAELGARLISALYGQEEVPCDVIEGILLVSHPRIREMVVVQGDEILPARHVRKVKGSQEVESKDLRTFSRVPLTLEELAKAF